MTTIETGAVRGEMGSGPFKGRGTLYAIVQELRRQIDARADWVADVRDLQVGYVVSDKDEPELRLQPRGMSARDLLPRAGLPVLEQAVAQIATRTGSGEGIPVGYFKRALRDNPSRLTDYVNGVWHDTPVRRLVRVLDDRVRAFLGQTYRPIDSLAIAELAVKLASEHDAYPIEASITDAKMRLRFVSRSIVERLEDVRQSKDNGGRGWFAGGLGSNTALARVHAASWGELPGDTAHPALGFSNSETGHGGCDLDGGLLLAVCFNLAWVRQLVHEVHIGARLAEGLWSDATRRKEIDLLTSQVGDAMRHYFTPQCFGEIVAAMKGTAAQVLHAPPRMLAEAAIKGSVSLRAGDLDALIAALSKQPGRPSMFNLGQGIARLAQDVDDADRAADVEALAGQVCLGKVPELRAAVLRAEKEAVLA